LAAKRPDIVILDAAVNDWLFSVAGIERNPGPSYGQLLDDIQAVGAIAVSLETMLPKYKQYQGCLTGQDMHTTQQIAHNVMVVSEKDGLCTVTTDGTLAQSDWSFDGVHPNDFGYQMLASLLTKNFEKVMATSQ
jgi:lysophospholipase L1-like esterase